MCSKLDLSLYIEIFLFFAEKTAGFAMFIAL